MYLFNFKLRNNTAKTDSAALFLQKSDNVMIQNG